MAIVRSLCLLQLLLLKAALAIPTHLNLTAISAANGVSKLECWQLTDPFTVSSTPGTTGTAIQQLGNASNASFTILPPEFDGGMHRAPAVQYVLFIAGLAHVTLPNSDDDAWIRGGEGGLIIAADTAAVSELGHITNYPSKRETLAVQIPMAGGLLPKHRVLYRGACRKHEVAL